MIWQRGKTQLLQKVKADQQITLDEKDAAFGYDFNTDQYVDMIKAGIIDPAKVTRTALQNAASIAGLLLTTDATVYELPKDEKPVDPHAAGGGLDHF